MNKGELIEAVANASGLSRADATKAVDATLDSITGNPRTGETIQIAASNVPGFKAGKALKDAVN